MARYVPNAVNDPAMQIELSRIAQALETAVPFVYLSTLHAAPTKIREGMIVLADGTDWDPGSGAGVYCYHSGTWNLLG